MDCQLLDPLPCAAPWELLTGPPFFRAQAPIGLLFTSRAERRYCPYTSDHFLGSEMHRDRFPGASLCLPQCLHSPWPALAPGGFLLRLSINSVPDLSLVVDRAFPGAPFMGFCCVPGGVQRILWPSSQSPCAVPTDGCPYFQRRKQAL